MLVELETFSAAKGRVCPLTGKKFHRWEKVSRAVYGAARERTIPRLSKVGGRGKGRGSIAFTNYGKRSS